jgi:hypothetical protein
MTELALSLELHAGSDNGLLRALTLLHRRRCRVLEVRYDRTDRLTVVVQAPSRHAHCVEAWLSSLVDVHAVTAHAGPGGPGAPD